MNQIKNFFLDALALCQKESSQQEGNGARTRARKITRTTRPSARSNQTELAQIKRGWVEICSHGNIGEPYLLRSSGLVSQAGSPPCPGPKARWHS